jgi:NADPH:quinone reductase-like Zn-dependent oxidoreductase
MTSEIAAGFKWPTARPICLTAAPEELQAETLLVMGAAGGVGTAVEISKTMGATIGVARASSKMAVAATGADHVIDASEDITAQCAPWWCRCGL